MIVGLLLRHYKVYQGMKFIPICNEYNHKFSMFIGDNGVGKSSVLEALNAFFNGIEWNITKGAKKDQAFIAPVFLIKRKDIVSIIGNDVSKRKTIEVLSDYFWSVEKKASPNFEVFGGFFEYRDSLKSKSMNDEYYLLVVGVEYQNKTSVSFITFDKDLKTYLSQQQNIINFSESDYNFLLETMKQYYKYIYIPVEMSPSDVLKIDGREVQDLMDADILDEIDKILTKKNFFSNSKHINLIDYINKHLNNYMDKINSVIEKIDSRYEYKVEGSYKKNLTSADVRKKILEAYFSIRTLKNDKREIQELSSGEQRIAIIDIATAFLINNTNNRKKQIILAIDEPENSVHISKAFSQFKRLNALADKYQVMITTHWYGALPISNEGMLDYLNRGGDNKVQISNFSLANYFENRKYLPSDIMLKGYFELTSTILSSMRADKTNWIICEGNDDKAYLELYLNNKINDLQIFCVGGCGNVLKLYRYIALPLSEKDELKYIESKILFLIDTDSTVVSIEESKDNECLKIARLQVYDDGTAELKNMGINGKRVNTEIEDCLDPIILYTALKNTIKDQYPDCEKEFADNFTFNMDAKTSRIKGEHSILKLVSVESLDKKESIYKMLDDGKFKYELCNNYIQLSREKEELSLPIIFDQISSYFGK